MKDKSAMSSSESPLTRIRKDQWIQLGSSSAPIWGVYFILFVLGKGIQSKSTDITDGVFTDYLQVFPDNSHPCLGKVEHTWFCTSFIDIYAKVDSLRVPVSPVACSLNDCQRFAATVFHVWPKVNIMSFDKVLLAWGSRPNSSIVTFVCVPDRRESVVFFMYRIGNQFGLKGAILVLFSWERLVTTVAYVIHGMSSGKLGTTSVHHACHVV